MYLRFERHRLRLNVALVIRPRVDGKARQVRLGFLGSVIWSEPISVAERIRFWTALDGRWRELVARHPGRLSIEDADKLAPEIDKHIPKPKTREEHVLLFQSLVRKDVMAALDALEQVEDGMEIAGKRLLALAREARREKRQREKQDG